ncbi:16S rRNA (cytosine(967)-C(5))-methyltransferase RsmB [Leuconostocaceae bacterium ESL0958]|nr:16S rRNA (cytosine(967)-C(5))-methyltransferase RsmB [Leuconostocaceae bacterium ESL0958]
MAKKITHSNNPRILAVLTLAKIKDGAYSNLQLNQVIAQNELTASDRAFLTTLVYGSIQHRLLLDYWLAPFIAKRKVEDWVQELLYTALFQWQLLDRVPKHAVFNESINVAKKLGHAGTVKFVTAILHQIDRQGLPALSAIKDPVERQSIEYSLPRWLVLALQAQVGAAKTTAILASLNQAPRQSVRVNAAKATRASAQAALEAEGFEVQPSQLAAEALLVTGGHVAASQAYQDGLVTLQDESAMLPVEALAIEDDVERVLDAAAAPGGKTTQIAAALPAGGQVTALDVHAHKLRLIEANAKRLGLSNRIQGQVLDARQVPNHFSEPFDRILVDAPCSGLGLLRRKPEIRYEKTPADVEKLANLQYEILAAVSASLRPGGRLVYSTCTILAAENDQVIARFLASHPDFEQIKTETQRPIFADRSDLALQLYPDDFDSDGFYIATLRRKDS